MNFKIITLLLFISINTLIAQPVITSITENNNSIEKYSKLELTVNLTASFNNPYDYSDINLQAIFTSPSGEKDTVDGFYYQDYTIIDQSTGELSENYPPIWKIRYAPTEIGTWQYQVICVNQDGVSNLVDQDFECISSNSKGYIRTANNMFMKFDDGSQFFGIGENLCWNVNSAGGIDVNQTFVNYTEWIDTLTAYNGNLFRVWMSDWAFAIEWNNTGLRNYSQRQTNAFYLDWLIEYAETKNAYIELCLNHHGQFVASSSNSDAIWDENPYNSANGGTCTNSYDFFTNTDAKNHYKNRLRYINARWGYSTAIFAWEQFNEMDLIGEYWTHRTDIADWTIEMASYIKSIDVNKHLNSTSFVQDNQGFDIWNADVIDYTQTHHYSADAEIELSLNSRTQNFLTEFDKPTKIGEYSLSTGGANIVIGYDDSGIHVHNASWSTALSGSFSISMSWWWKWYINNQNIQAYKNFEEIGNFISSIDLLENNLSPVNFDCETNTSSAFYIIPAFGWGLAPENNFTVNNDGSLNPSPDSLSVYLYGNEVNTSIKNPPTFNVNYPQDGYFTVRTGSETQYNPTIEIWLDGANVLNENAVINTDYTIEVTAGSHQIFVDNNGHDWIKIEKYYSSYDSSTINVKANGLVCNNATYGWVHNRDYNWEYISANGEPNTVNNARIIIPGLIDGDYDITFFNTFSGEIVSQEIGESTSEILFANIPELLWDFSFKIIETNSTSLNNNIKKNNKAIFVYPNPSKNILFLEIKDEKLRIKNEVVQIIDINGKTVKSTVIASEERTWQSVQTDSREQSSHYDVLSLDVSSLPKGTYFVKIGNQTQKFVKE